MRSIFVAIVFISLAAISCYDEETKSGEEVIQLINLTTTPITANGEKVNYFWVALGAETLNGEHRSIKFTSTGVTFLQEEVYVPRDSAKVIVRYIPNTTPGTFEIKAAISDDDDVYIKRSITLVAPRSQDVLDISFTPTAPIADGTTPITVAVQIKDYKTGKIQLSTTQGTFSQSEEPKSIELDVDASDNASTLLIPGVSSVPHLITAKIANTEVVWTKSITPAVAYPDDLYVEPSAYKLKVDEGSITIDVSLSRNTGKTSAGIPLTIKAWQQDGSDQVDVGSLKGFPFKTDETEKVSFSFSNEKNPAAVDTKVSITVTTRNDKNETISKTIEVSIVDE